MPKEVIAQSDIGAGILTFHLEQVLLVQMNYGRFKGSWILPGGMVEEGEHPHAGAKRELKEETNLEVKDLKLLTLRHRIKTNGKHNSYFVFSGVLTTEDPQSNIEWPKEELIEVKFWDVSEALQSQSVRHHTKHYIKMALGQVENSSILELPSEFSDFAYS